MKKLPLLLFLLAACAPKAQPCTPEGRAALLDLYKIAVDKTIASGACDKYQDVGKCPAYSVVEAHFLAAERGLCAK